jgi:glycosyltransferase involved in cell wall biosynthesis
MKLTHSHSLTSRRSLRTPSSEPEARATRPLRIVHVAASYAPLVGGGERLLQAVSERLVLRGHDVTVLTFDCKTRQDYTSSTGAGLPARDVLNGVRIVRVSPATPRLETLLRWWLKLPGGWRSSKWLLGDAPDAWALSAPSGLRILSPLARLRADVVTSVGWCFGVSFWASLPRAFRRAPRIAIPLLHIEREWASNSFYNRMIADTDASIVCTNAERDFIEARGGSQVAVAGAGVDPNRFTRRNGAAIRARFGIAGPTVGFVGRQDVTKGVPTLIEAMHTVWREIPDAFLLLAGQSAHRHEKVTEKLASLTAARRRQVVLVDDFADEELPSIMDACDLLALPSAEEAFGMVMIEAWMCGKPVIGADIASTRCIIDVGVDGLTTTPYDPQDLATKVLELLADERKRAAFGERGRRKVLERYTWDRVTDVWESTFQRVAGTV